MANYANLLATIAANIYTNGNQEVTAAMVKTAMNAAINSLGAGYQFMGVAHPADTPSGYADLRAFWLAGEAGTYTNFGGLVLADGSLGILKYDGSWSLETIAGLGGGGDLSDYFAETVEDGFFVVDPHLNVGMRVNEDGIAPGGAKGNPESIRVAASDSSAFDKSRADYICDGTHDELTIQTAVDALPEAGEVVLAAGTYHIDGFRAAADGHQGAIIISNTAYAKNRIKIRGERDSDLHCVLDISASAYASLQSGTPYSVISASRHVFNDYPKHAMFENLHIRLPDNKKDIIGFDGWYFGSVRYTNCQVSNATADNYLHTNIPSSFYGTMGCIGFRGTQGSNNAIDMIWTNCSAYGVGQGFAVSGEHLVMIQCAGVACKYGYTFNSTPTGSGTFIHPMTLINCCDERGENLPRFYGNNGRQAVTMVDFNIERLASDAIQDYAVEETPGTWRGRIEYTIQSSYSGGGNDVSVPFWEDDGSGVGIDSRNQAQLRACATGVRNGYAPNFYQQLYDTTLNKLMICTDPANKTWVEA